MKAISKLINWKDGNPTNKEETHWVFHNVALKKDISNQLRAGDVFPTAILHVETPTLILIDKSGKENIVPLNYSV
jgi:hypothetical protein